MGVLEGKMRRLLVLLPMLVTAGLVTASAAIADGLDVNWREARVVKLAKPATSVVVGDPTVADVTLDDPTTVIVFGKSPGETNLIVLSASQELLLDWPLVVNPVNDRHVTVLNASSQTAPTEVLYSCGNQRCVRVLSPSDVQFSSSTSSTTNANTDASKTSASSSVTSQEASPTGAGINTGGGETPQQPGPPSE